MSSAERADWTPGGAELGPRPRGAADDNRDELSLIGLSPGWPLPPHAVPDVFAGQREWRRRPASPVGAAWEDTGGVADRQQTHLRVSPRAFESLEALARARGVSQPEVVRALLREHVAAQSQVPEEHRLTHVSTVLRFPPPPAYRGDDDGRRRLAPRLEPGLAAAAVSMSLRLPGQPARRGFRDYAPRPLTDAVTTAIARVMPYVDEGLEGLPPLLRHREALGLWRLVVAATLTRAEQRALLTASPGPAAVVLREEDVAWHDPWRFEVARHLAVGLLAGEKEADGRRMLWDQGEEFDRLRHDLERSDLDHPLLEGLTWPANDLQGRGGAAVWRAERVLSLERLAKWMTTGGGAGTVAVDPPGWMLQGPSEWLGMRFRHGDALPAQQQADLTSGRILRVTYGSRSVLWPYDAAGGPVAGFSDVLAGAGDMSPAEAVELVLVTADDIGTYPFVPASTACTLGFISDGERDSLVADAEAQIRAEIADVLRRAARVDPADRAALTAAKGDLARFERLARRLHLRCWFARPSWRWEVESLQAALADGASAAQLRWLAEATRGTRAWALERSMREASNRAFWQGGPPADDMM